MRRLSKWPVIARKAGQLLQESVASCARIRTVTTKTVKQSEMKLNMVKLMTYVLLSLRS